MLIHNSDLDASSFTKSKGFYHEEFKTVLKLLIFCYNEILNLETPQSYEKGFKLENHLRNVLVKNYLRKYKERYGISYLGFEIESGEIDINDVTVGFIDIKVVNAGLVTSMKCDEDVYYAIECKRLDKYSSKISKYVEEGILRFINGKYSNNMPLAGMLGFIEKNTPDIILGKIIDKLNNEKCINTINNLDNCVLQDDFEYSYLSKHERKDPLGPIDIYHLLFDYTSLILIEED